MTIYFKSLSQQVVNLFDSFNKNIQTALTAQQKKIFIIVSVALGFLAIGYLIKPYFTKKAVLLNEHDKQTRSDDVVKIYFEKFEEFSKSEKWQEIISQGTVALEASKKASKPQDEAKICAQLTSTAFYLGDYNQALLYANRCHELSEEFIDPSLLLRALYLESAVHRALAAKCQEEQAQQASYLRAVKIGEEALSLYSKKEVKNINLQGKIYFNLGAAHADNPKGDLKAAMDCYLIAIKCFKDTKAVDDVIRTNMRLGKVHLLQKNYDLSQQVLDDVRSLIANERLSMHADYLEAQLKMATNDRENALKIAKDGLKKAENLGAKEDELRLTALLKSMEAFQA